MPLMLDGAFALIESTLAPESTLDEASAEAIADALNALKKNPRDRKAQNDFASAAQGLINNLARSAARRHPNLDADDIAQEVMVSVTKGQVGRGWRGGNANAAKRFIGTLVKNVMRDMVKAAKREKRGGDVQKFSMDAPVGGKDGEGGFDVAARGRTAPSARMQGKELKGAIKRVVERFTKDPQEQQALALWMSAVKGEDSSLMKGSTPNWSEIARRIGDDSRPQGRKVKRLVARFIESAKGALRPFMDDYNLVMTALVEAMFGIDPNSPWLTTEAACDLLEGALLNG